MFRHPIVLLAIVALVAPACASSGAPRSRPPQMVENREIQNRSQTVTSDALPGSPGEVWPALQAVYEELELEVTASDPVNRVLAARQNRMRSLGGKRNSNWVDCGDDLTGPVADKSFVTFDVVSQLTSASETTTRLQVQLQARGRRRDNASGELLCASEGRLEMEIHARVIRRLATG